MNAAVLHRTDVIAAPRANLVGAQVKFQGSRPLPEKKNETTKEAFAVREGKYAVAWQGGATAERVQRSDVTQFVWCGLHE